MFKKIIIAIFVLTLAMVSKGYAGSRNGWIYQDPNGAQAFTKGTIRMDPQDIAKAMDLFYEVMGWDKATGAPTTEAYARLGLQSVAESLTVKKLVPGGKG